MLVIEGEQGKANFQVRDSYIISIATTIFTATIKGVEFSPHLNDHIHVDTSATRITGAQTRHALSEAYLYIHNITINNIIPINSDELLMTS